MSYEGELIALEYQTLFSEVTCQTPSTVREVCVFMCVYFLFLMSELKARRKMIHSINFNSPFVNSSVRVRIRFKFRVR